jgi:ribosomal protein S8E
MRGETQSVHLAEMMQKHKLYPEYELVLPLLFVKKNNLKKLSKGDVLLLGDDHLNLKLLKEDEFFGNVEIEESENSRKIKIINIQKHTEKPNHSKKYEIVKCSFDFLQSRSFEVGHKIDISSTDLGKVNLLIGNKKLAEGKLVNVDEEIAIEITKVGL